MSEYPATAPHDSDLDPFWVEQRAKHLAEKSTSADPNACGTCRSNAEAGQPVKHDECQQRATLLHAPDHPDYEILAGFSLEENAKLPARFHVPVFDDCGKPNAWLCAVCWEEGVVTGWPCATAVKYGTKVFSPLHEAETAQKKMRAAADELRAENTRLKARVTELEAVAVEARAALGALCYDLEDPGSNALGALYLLQQATVWTEARPDDASDALARHAAEVLNKVADMADPEPPEVSFFGDHGGTVATWLRMLADRKSAVTS